MRPTMCFLMAVCVVFLAGGVAQAGEKMLAHDVFFTLKDRSPEAKANLVAACKKYLTGHPGTVWFAVGPLAEEFNRDVNDRQFDVALHLVFKDKAAHDQYAKAERHMKFIEEMEATWEKVRVFDSYVDGFDHGTVSMTPEGGEQPRKFFLPDQAASFAGMIQGEVKELGQHAKELERARKQARLGHPSTRIVPWFRNCSTRLRLGALPSPTGSFARPRGKG